ncbi:MAG: hypothetical protein ACFNL6_00345 [Candidatus Nanoperiomorbus sp.]
MFKKKWSRSDIPESVSADSEKEHPAPDMGAEWNTTSEGKPSDVKVNYFFSQLREELGRIRKTLGSSDNAVSLAFASICNLERHIAAQEKKSQETVMSPEEDHSVAQKISELRESLGDESPRETENSSSKEEELILVRPVKGVDENGRLILGDPKLLRADALKS